MGPRTRARAIRSAILAALITVLAMVFLVGWVMFSLTLEDRYGLTVTLASAYAVPAAIAIFVIVYYLENL